ncbi:MAG TPA: hypothetical protein VGF82_22290 [Terracidiphilus sp.]|jgi:hypothetical protein
MSSEDIDREPQGNDPLPEEPPMRGVNIKLIYSLIALAILGAMAIAFSIVLPFYHRH